MVGDTDGMERKGNMGHGVRDFYCPRGEDGSRCCGRLFFVYARGNDLGDGVSVVWGNGTAAPSILSVRISRF